MVLLPDIDPVGLVSAHRLPGDRVLTIAASQIMRGRWLDGDRALEHARRLLKRWLLRPRKRKRAAIDEQRQLEHEA